MKTFERLESEVRSYCRSFPVVFEHASGAILTDTAHRDYVDFFAGAGALNYGHNPPEMRERLVDYLCSDGVTHGLDLATRAKESFLETFEAVVLRPRGMAYKLQFPGPTGTNAVEAALKLARKVTGRTNVVHFANSFHGMTLGALAVTGNAAKRAGAGVPLPHGVALPFDGDVADSLGVLELFLDNPGSGVDKPAAVIVETIQAEGGVKVASTDWLRRLWALTEDHGVLLIVDDIQVGCGRTGPFFSFEEAGIRPDVICLSKSLSGYGLPFALVLLAPHLDVWNPGEHNGTFRGHNLAFVTAVAALEHWRDDRLTHAVERKAALIRGHLEDLVQALSLETGETGEPVGEVRGRGLIQGIAFTDRQWAGRASRAAFERGLIIETAGVHGEVLKLLPPLTIEDELLERGLSILAEAVRAAAPVTA